MQGKNEYMTNEQSAFLHFLIRFTRAIQRNEKSWDTLFLYAFAVAPLCVIDSLCVIARRDDEAIHDACFLDRFVPRNDAKRQSVLI